jgi:hypothetical protein
MLLIEGQGESCDRSSPTNICSVNEAELKGTSVGVNVRHHQSGIQEAG